MENYKEEFFIFNAGSIDCRILTEREIIKIIEVKEKFYKNKHNDTK